MAEQIFVGDGSFEDATDGEEVFVGVALFSEDDAAPGGTTVPVFDHYYRMRRAC
jgi:hypothetical protein